jgi:chloramphenicol-sensitive protein RarD
MEDSKKGYLSAIFAFLLWGSMPLYMNMLSNVSTSQIVVHRIIWSVGLLIPILYLSKELKSFYQNITPKNIAIYAFTALCVGSNWVLYILTVKNGRVLEASLGYFINPLASVLLGIFILKEKLRPWQIVSVSLAAFGVAYLSFDYGRIPWFALGLAITFAVYGLVRKLSPLGATQGLTLETLILLPVALSFLIYYIWIGESSFGHAGVSTDLWLLSTGVMTTIPLLLFNIAAQRISLTHIGIIQYIGPSLQFITGVFLFHEAISTHRLIGFIFVWLGLLVFCSEGLIRNAQKTSVLKTSS